MINLGNRSTLLRACHSRLFRLHDYIAVYRGRGALARLFDGSADFIRFAVGKLKHANLTGIIFKIANYTRSVPVVLRCRYWYDTTDPKAFHSAEEIDDHIKRLRKANDIDVFRRNPDLLAMLKARVSEHPEERRGWRHVLDAL